MMEIGFVINADTVVSVVERDQVWVKREQMVREAAARRIQRWTRQQRSRRAIAVRIAATRRKWLAKYSSTVSQSHVQMSAANGQTRWETLLSAAIRIQLAWRTFIDYRATVLGFAPALKRKFKAQSHQTHQINLRVINAVAHFGSDVKQLQQVCVVQERAMIELWDNTARLRRYLDYRIDKAMICFQVRAS